MPSRALPLLAALALAGCGTTAPAEWPGPPRPQTDGSVDVQAFDDYLDENEDDASSPEALATAFLRLDEAAATMTTLVVTRGAEGGGDRARVVATLAGVPDDSVESVRYVLVVTSGKGGWRLESAVRRQRCRAGRGHAAFSAEPCL